MVVGEFLYVFALMFIGIFGFAMLIRLLAQAFLRQSGGFDVYIKADENAAAFVEFARGSGQIRQVGILLTGGEFDAQVRLLAQKYPMIRLAEPGQGEVEFWTEQV